jgi:hypothetical protein
MADWLIPLVMGALAAAAVLYVVVSKGGANTRTRESPISRPPTGLELRAPLEETPRPTNELKKLTLIVGMIGLALVLIAILASEVR